MSVTFRTSAAVWSNMASVCARVALPSGHVMFTNTLSCGLFAVLALRPEHVARTRCKIDSVVLHVSLLLQRALFFFCSESLKALD